MHLLPHHCTASQHAFATSAAPLELHALPPNNADATAQSDRLCIDLGVQPNGLPSSSAPGAQPQHAPSPYLTNPATGLPYGATAAATISLPFSQSHAAPTPLHHGSAAPHPPVPAAAVHRLRPQASLLPRPTYRPHNGVQSDCPLCTLSHKQTNPAASSIAQCQSLSAGC